MATGTVEEANNKSIRWNGRRTTIDSGTVCAASPYPLGEARVNFLDEQLYKLSGRCLRLAIIVNGSRSSRVHAQRQIGTRAVSFSPKKR